jgi:NhaC family Na+:H+ antiporter
MGASILTAVPLCLLLQGMDAASLLRTAVFGYHSADPAVAAMLDGGGVVSMARVGAIVCLSSSYAGIFRKTGLLEGLKKRVRALTARTTDFCGVLVTGVLVSLIACNQTLSTLLTAQLCEDEARPAAALALDLEDSVIVTAALVPWSIAGATPLASVGAPMSAMFFACYLYLLPLWRLLGSFWEKARQRAGE